MLSGLLCSVQTLNVAQTFAACGESQGRKCEGAPKVGQIWVLFRMTFSFPRGGVSPTGSAVKNLPAMQETQEMQFRSLGWEDPSE